MRLTERVKEIIELNIANHYVPLIVQSDRMRAFPVYFARIMKENLIAIPVTGATGIDEALREETPAMVMVVDRAGGYEAYVLEGTARHLTRDQDYRLVTAMRNEVPSFPIHSAVIFKVESVHLVPPP